MQVVVACYDSTLPRLLGVQADCRTLSSKIDLKGLAGWDALYLEQRRIP